MIPQMTMIARLVMEWNETALFQSSVNMRRKRNIGFPRRPILWRFRLGLILSSGRVPAEYKVLRIRG